MTERYPGERLEFLSPRQFVRLAISRKRLHRADEPNGLTLGLYDPETNIRYVVRRSDLVAHSRLPLSATA